MATATEFWSEWSNFSWEVSHIIHTKRRRISTPYCQWPINQDSIFYLMTPLQGQNMTSPITFPVFTSFWPRFKEKDEFPRPRSSNVWRARDWGGDKMHIATLPIFSKMSKTFWPFKHSEPTHCHVAHVGVWGKEPPWHRSLPVEQVDQQQGRHRPLRLGLPRHHKGQDWMFWWRW